MRFVHLHARRFGPLRDRSLAFGSDALVVFGPNESGKSSLRAALETIVYGFEPATRDKHPLYLWDGGSGGDLCVEAELLLDSGETQRVERVLQATGKLRTAPGREGFAGKREGNRPLPWASLPREVFQAVYSLELEELVALDRNVQGQLDDLLLPESPGVELLSAARVREALREEMQRLWRGDRLGRPLARALREKLALARARAVAAGAAESGLRECQDELARLEAELAELKRCKEALAGLARIAELEAERRAPAARLARAELALSPPEALRLERAAEVEARAARADRDAAALERAAELETRAAAQRADEERELARALAAPIDAARREAARRAELDGLRRAHEEWARALEAHAQAPTPAGALPAGPLAALAAGAVALAAGLLLEVQLLSAAGALLLAAAIALVLVRAQRGPQVAPPPAPESLRRAAAELGARAELLASPSALLRLVEGLERARQRGDDAARDEADAERLRGGAAAHEAEDRTLSRELGVDPEGPPVARAVRLRTALAHARAREKEAERDRTERSSARDRLAALDERRARLREPLGRDPVAARAAAAAAEAAGAPDAALRECDPAIERASGRTGELRQRLAADPGSARAAAQDEITALEAELAEAMRQHDRLALLESIVARAESGWRDAHQPDVLRRAGDYLRRITDGRYTRLDVDAASRVLAVTPAGGEPRAVSPPLSSGTRDQIHLCLRLGLLDHLDEDRERLPLILDDALLRTDGLRRPEVWELLAHAARRRQIFVLTCQESIAREAEEALKVPRIDLSA